MQTNTNARLRLRCNGIATRIIGPTGYPLTATTAKHGLESLPGVFYISIVMPKLKFEKLDVDGLPSRMNRAKVPGGWLLVFASNSGGGATFYPDPEHKWNGGSVADDRKIAVATSPAPRKV
jgi:hypothetical protein